MNFCSQVRLLKALGRFLLSTRIMRPEKERLFYEKYASNSVCTTPFCIYCFCESSFPSLVASGYEVPSAGVCTYHKEQFAIGLEASSNYTWNKAQYTSNPSNQLGSLSLPWQSSPALPLDVQVDSLSQHTQWFHVPSCCISSFSKI